MKRALKLLMLCLIAAASSTAIAQNYPNRPIKLIIGYGPGGVTDVLNRLIADEISKRVGQPVLVENRPGAGALLASRAVKLAPPDGYALFGGSGSTFSPVMMQDSLDITKELAPISMFASGDWFMYVPTSIGVGNLRELAAYAKANAGKFRFSSPSPSNTMLMAMVAKHFGFTFENIPYKASDQTIQAMLTGDGHVTFNAASGFGPQIQAGKLRAIATLSPKRSAMMPDVPTAQEQNVPIVTQFEVGLWAPLGTPRDIIMKLNAAVVEGLKNPATVEKIRNASLQPASSTPEALLEANKAALAFYTEAAALIGFKPL